MRVFNKILSAQKFLRSKKQKNTSIGFVPTMGSLHEGHLELIRRARRENKLVVVSIFVNPKQFGRGEDYTKYPREEKRDKLLLKREKVDIIIYPSAEEVYPKGYRTYVEVENLDKHLCGKRRPGHFRGVTTVVCKLLNIVSPDTLYVGQKDVQQAMIIAKMIGDLNMNVKLKVCPTVREKDGLALSSRNQYLTQKQREQAPLLYQTLKKAKQSVNQGERKTNKLISTIKKELKKTTGIIDYIECVDVESLQTIKTIKGQAIIALAVKFGKARLIDNITVKAR